MQKFALALVTCLCGAQMGAADSVSRLPMPDDYIELVWSAQFAAVIADKCADFALKIEPQPRLAAFLDTLAENGVDLENADEVYEFPPNFNAESVSSLILASNITNKGALAGLGHCELGGIVFGSDMLTAAMLERAEPLGGS